MKFFIIAISIILLFEQAGSNEPFVVLEYKGMSGAESGLNKENIFIKNQNHSVVHKVQSGESLSSILNKYYGKSGLNMKVIEISIIEMNKHAFVRNNPHFLYAGKKIKIPFKTLKYALFYTSTKTVKKRYKKSALQIKKTKLLMIKIKNKFYTIMHL